MNMTASKTIATIVCAALIASLSPALRCAADMKITMPKNGITIAALPFDNKNRDKNFSFLTSAFPDEITSRLAGLDRIKVIAQRALYAQIGHYQAIGGELNEKEMVERLEKLKFDYIIAGSFRIESISDRTASSYPGIVNVEARVTDPGGKVLATVELRELIKNWHLLPGKVVIALVEKIGIKITDADRLTLEAAGTKDYKAFRLNHTGKLYERLSHDKKNKDNAANRKKLRDLSQFYYSQAIQRDASYLNAKMNHAESVLESNETISEKEQEERNLEAYGHMLNCMTIFAFRSSNETNVQAWLNLHGERFRRIANNLPLQYTVEIQGHSSSASDAREESLARARLVGTELLKLGVTTSRIRYSGLGDANIVPWLDAKDPANNRVTFRIVGLEQAKKEKSRWMFQSVEQ